MAKGIYVGVSGEVKRTGNIIPTTWTRVSDTKYIASDGTILTSSEARPPNYVDKACDGNETSCFAGSEDVTEAYVQIEFPEPKKITKIRTHVSVGVTTYLSYVFVQGSNDGTSWTYLASLAYMIQMPGMDEITFLASNVNYYKYYRIYALHTAAPTDGTSLTVYEWQTTEYVISQTDKACKVKKAYIGVSDKARKVKKGYIGVNDIAQLFYSAETLIPFTSNPAPTTWTDSSDYLSATATNKYGEWSIEATNPEVTSVNPPSHAFDNDTSTGYSSHGIETNSTVYYLYIHLPEGVSIRPDTIYAKYYRCGNSTNLSYFQGYDGEKWVDLRNLQVSNSVIEETLDVSQTAYYTKFRIMLYRFSSSYASPLVYDFKITSGTLKIE